MEKSLQRIRMTALTLLVFCMVAVPCIAAGECDRPLYPHADFICKYPGTRPQVPDGPPFVIECYDRSSTSQPITSWRWEFGDGEISTEQSPRHIYAEPGRYEVRLSVSTSCGRTYSDMAIDLVYVYCSIPVPEFETSVREGFAPLAVEVTDTSHQTPEDITTWTYWFDNNHSTHTRNPVFIYSAPGTYTINQSVKKDCVEPGRELPPPYSVQIKVNERPALLFYVTTTTTTVPTLTATPPALSSQVTLTTGDAISPARTTIITTPSKKPQLIPVAAVTTSAIPVVTHVAGTGTLSVTTDPAGAQVFVDDMSWGASPATIPNLAAGAHTLRLEMAGYQNLSVPVTITEGKTSEYSLALVPVVSSGDNSTGMLPLIAGAVIIIGLVGAGAYFFTTKKKVP